MVQDKVFQFGRERSLVGILSDPQDTQSSENRPAVLILNSGLLHRVGPNRLYVKIARTLASMGFLVFRFDLSGIGDSQTRTDNTAFEESSISETQEAMDFLTSARNVQKFVLTGICSGAHIAFNVACLDARVVGIIPIDFYATPSRRYFIQEYKRRVFSFRRWWNLLSGRSNIWTILIKKRTVFRSAQYSGPSDEGAGRETHERTLAGFQTLVQRNASVLLIYSGGSPGYYNYRMLFEKELSKFSCDGKFQIMHFETSDHEFTLLYHQKLLIETISEWMRKWSDSTGNP
jgi:pimeloyl-ACP methyl ester carboxylesterase